MTELDEPVGPEQVMTDEEKDLADKIYAAVQYSSTSSERSRQAQDFVIGVSDLGTCAERTRRTMVGIPQPDTDKLEAFMGTWVGLGIEQAVTAMDPQVRTQITVTVKLEGDGGMYEFEGHGDLCHPWGYGDVKTSDGLGVARRTGPSRQQLFQRHLMTLGLFQAGELSVPLEEARTYNVWFDRSGRTKECHVHMDTFSPEIVHEATAWLDEVVYAVRTQTEAQKEPPRTWCEKVCGYFATCRMYDSDVEGLLLDPELAAAVVMDQEAKELARRVKQLKKDSAAVLTGVNGYVRGADGRNFQVRNTWVNPSEVAYERSGYWRLNVTPVKGQS